MMLTVLCSSFTFRTSARAGSTFIKAQGQTTSTQKNTLTRSLSSLSAATMPEQETCVSHPDFETVKTYMVKEYGCTGTLYKHKATSCEVLSLRSADTNKVFGITFTTPNPASTGVAHILEHSVLCGSRKYTTKEPFVELMRGSVNTFLNAFTYPDRTCYPVASQNTKDFKNLVNVYLDAVLFPRCVKDPNVHAQEGWHLEHENGELTYKGVVYNEMKGVYSSPDSLSSRESQRSLFPDNVYGTDSGGDPLDIPNLSFDNFRQFWEEKYNPGNAKVFFYGDDDESERLDLLTSYLNDYAAEYGAKSNTAKVEWQPKKFEEPVEVRSTFPVGETGGKDMVTANWLLNDEPMSSVEGLKLNVLDHLLMGNTKSVLRKSLSDSGLGEDITGGGLSDELLQATFSVGMKGVGAPEDGSEENINKVLKTITTTLEEISAKGFDEEDVKASMNAIEFQLREFNTGSFPKGLSLMLGSISGWIYGNDPVENLEFEVALSQLKAQLSERGGEVWKDAIKEYLINNTHKSIVIMKPDPELEKKVVEEEKSRLEQIKAGMTEDDIKEIERKMNELKQLQAKEDTAEDIATIPTLNKEDLETKVEEYPIEVIPDFDGSGVTVVENIMPSTSGVIYTNFGIDVSDVDLEDMPLLPLFCRILMETGAGQHDDVQLTRRINTYTGGVSASFLSTAVKEEGVSSDMVSDGSKMVSKIFIKGKATAENAGEMFDIMRLVLTESNLDSQDRIVEMLKEAKSRSEASVKGSGHSLVNTRIKARLSTGGALEEMIGGFTYLETLKGLLDMAENDFPKLKARLESMKSKILAKSKCRDGMVLNVVAEDRVREEADGAIKAFLNELPGDSSPTEKFQNFYTTDHPWAVEAKKKICDLKNEAFVVPTQVNYVGSGGRLYEEGESMPGAANVVARYLRTGYLWDTVRVIGGAYGGFCTLGASSGLFTFLSYRDPNLAVTLDAYDGAAAALLEQAENLTAEQLQTAVIGAVGDLDPALSPDQKGSTQFRRWLSGENAEDRQKQRDAILSTSKEDFIAFAKKLQGLKDLSTAVVTSAGMAEEAIKSGKEMDVIEVL